MEKNKVLTPAQRAFIDLIVEGKTRAEAYRIAYNRPNAGAKRAAEMGGKVANGAAVSAELARICELATEKAAERLSVTKEYVMRSLKEVADRCMQHRPVLDRNGKQVWVETPNGEERPAFLFDAKGAVAALVPLGKEIGMFVERKEVRTGPLADVPDEKLDERIREIVKEHMERTGRTLAQALEDFGLSPAVVKAAKEEASAVIARAADTAKT